MMMRWGGAFSAAGWIHLCVRVVTSGPSWRKGEIIIERGLLGLCWRNGPLCDRSLFSLLSSFGHQGSYLSGYVLSRADVELVSFSPGHVVIPIENGTSRE